MESFRDETLRLRQKVDVIIHCIHLALQKMESLPEALSDMEYHDCIEARRILMNIVNKHRLSD